MIKHLISENSTLRNALKQMDENKVKFLVAVDNNNHISGTLTDGDIRRAILKGLSLDGNISDAICRDYTYVKSTEGLSGIIELFQNDRIEFLPVIADDGAICNIVTRRGLNVLLLTNTTFSIDFDFDKINENALEHNIFSRPWGFYKTTILNEMFQAKIINVYPEQALSLQSHNHREEYWIVVNGEGIVILEGSERKVMPGSMIFIPKGCKHRMINTSETETLIFTEVQIGDYFGEDDIVRYSDNYNRT